MSMFKLVFFFFKQKTAYEMRISDWSSDVCSSDLTPASRWIMSVVAALNPWVRKTFRAARRTVRALAFSSPLLGGGEVMTWLVRRICLDWKFLTRWPGFGIVPNRSVRINLVIRLRSEERRVGKECVRTCRSRGAP